MLEPQNEAEIEAAPSRKWSCVDEQQVLGDDDDDGADDDDGEISLGDL